MRCFKADLFVVCSCLFFSFISGQRRSRSCTTPNGETAQCIQIHSCPKLLDAVTTRDQQQRKFLRDSQCGFSGSKPLVCCGSYDNYNTNNRGSSSEDYGWGTEDQTSDLDRRGSNNNRGTSQGGASKLPSRTSCGFQEVDRILDGQVTGLREFPWMALLQYRRKSGSLVFSCGGSLISSRYVLTAAHCVRGQILTKIGPLVTVRLGEYNTDTDKDCSSQFGFEICNDKPVDAQVEKTIVHPDYSDSSADRYNDIALVKLKRDVAFTDFVKPICLPTRAENSRVGDKLVVAGWGRTEYASSSPVKLKLWVPIAQRSQCSNKFQSAGVNIGSTQLCAGGELGRDSCSGDSGGPLMATTKNDSAQWYIEGIVSFGAKCGSQGWPGIYTKVGEFIDWIQSNAT